MIATTLSTHAHQTANIMRLTLCIFPTVNPHIRGKNWEYMITHIIAPCAAKRKSLKRVVVVGASGCLIAYWDFIVGEYRKAAVEMV